MADEIESIEVLELIEHELAQARESGLDPQHELFVAVRSAMTDDAEDFDGKAAAALATLLAYGSISSQEDLDRTLGDLAQRVEGLQGIRDVHYLGTGTLEYREISLREHLPREVEHQLTYEEREELEGFIATAFRQRTRGPDDEPGPQHGGPSP